MKKLLREDVDIIFPSCISAVGRGRWNSIASCFTIIDDFEAFRSNLFQKGGSDMPGFLPDLALLEWKINRVSTTNPALSGRSDRIRLNPALQLLRLSWKNLTYLLQLSRVDASAQPDKGEELVLIWTNPESGELSCRPALNEDLIALKIVADDIEPRKVAPGQRESIVLIDAVINQAVRNGLLLAPASGIRRQKSFLPKSSEVSRDFLSSDSFTLQWHITQTCDLHCKHCYDRSDRKAVTLDQGMRILDDLHDFCRDRYVMGAVSFTGGNPLMHPDFMKLYGAAATRGFSLSILGNPCSQDRLEEIISIQKPYLFQVSLEGLSGHNDRIRGRGHFGRILEFLKILRRLEVYSMVMLTLTKDNMDQVVPLAGLLRECADKFHFNRLSMVGEGSNLRLPERREYAAFLESCVEAAEGNPIMGLKDNLINIIRYRSGEDLFGGCAGFGCGAAFNFLAVLPDGEVHACRKFPSPIGDIFDKSLSEIYDSDTAARYRSGCSACSGCPIRPVCGGCLASAYSHGRNIFEEKDPFCFMDIY
ncbi:MAG TPA: thio(seleno)oxazole modification radical SAM maturase SbtM [Thermodesulfovibrionales bacterium]|nr:thio(seleno)oxazole modification radical SAM maturase SbtM [Thermodesulfovibrionales bacterium]